MFDVTAKSETISNSNEKKNWKKSLKSKPRKKNLSTSSIIKHGKQKSITYKLRIKLIIQNNNFTTIVPDRKT
ncbi:hypothetical protein DERF_005385 [Dermatophagoides farinae]|uniref:Uncharacterized protein n=1 Tax=Dermatophagoides farinae TaxID=6954 RepID=A0A922L738_DERFA|nr:hypothetical protein DERF_005385 [Dermatophagoides farinae]